MTKTHFYLDCESTCIQVSWPNVVEGNPKAPFPIATIQSLAESATPYPWSVPYNAEC